MNTKEKILIIDDEEPILNATAHILRTSGYNVITANNGIDAIEKVATELPDLILTDGSMPEMSGLEICKNIKQNYPEIYVVIYSGTFTSSEQQAYGLESGADGYILKTASKRELIARIEVLLRLQKVEKELRNSNLIKDKMSSLISHDLRGLFMPIIGFTEMIYNKIGNISDEDLRRYISVVHDHSIHIEGLLENVLYWSKNQINQPDPEIKFFNLHEIVQAVLDVNKIKAKNKNITINNNIDVALKINSDRNIISLALRNLISNALKFTNNDGEIKISYEDFSDKFQITVTDNGMGMSAEIQAKLFNFDKSKIREGTANEQGTGLGLMTSHEYIKKMNGEIRVESKEGEGCKFIIELVKS